MGSEVGGQPAKGLILVGGGEEEEEEVVVVVGGKVLFKVEAS